MQKTDADCAEILISTSMRIPKSLHEHFMQKSNDLGLSLPKTLAYLLEQSSRQAIVEPKPDYGLLTYTLLGEAIHNFVEDAQGLINQALSKAEQLSDPKDVAQD